ncbi:MAG: pilus assembly PilX family protein [Candidatus Aquicultor sp.]
MIKRIIKDEQGIAMVVVVGLMLIITALAFGAIAVSESDLKLSARDQDSMQALHVADAGIQKTLWQLEQYGNSIPEKKFTVPVGNGTASVNATQDSGSQWYWTIESSGTCGEAHRKVKVTVFNFSLWNLNMGLGQNNSLASGGNGLLGTTSIDGPFYVRGNVQLTGNSSITGGPFFVKTGTLRFMDNGSNLGTESSPVAAYIEPADGNEDILDKQGDPLNPGDPQVKVSQLSNQCPDIQLPPMDSQSSYWTTACNESSPTGGSIPEYRETGGFTSGTHLNKVLDTDMGGPTNQPVEARHMYLLNNSAEDFGSTTGFGWDKVNRKLYVNGTIFVDGNLTIGDSMSGAITYYGRGTIVANGTITINGQLRPPYDPLKGAYDINGTHVLGLVTDETIDINTLGSGSCDRSSPDVSGAFFASKEVKINQNNTTFVGSMIAGVLNIADSTNNSHLFTHPSLPDFLPPSLPGSTKFLAMTSSWREVP